MTEDDRRAYREDLEQLREAGVIALVAAQSRSLSDAEIVTLAHLAGLVNDVYPEIRK